MNMESYNQKTIVQDLNDLKLIFPILMNNLDAVSYFTKILENGGKEKDRN